jgi:iron complex outermembrane receptor protein
MGPLMRQAGAALLVAALAVAAPAAAARQKEKVDPSELKELSLEELMQIDVTSVSKRSEQLSRAAAAITVITRDDLRRSGVTSLPEALRLANGLEVARENGRNWAIAARGFNISTSNKMLVLIDGRSVYTQLFSGVFWDVQDVLLEDVDRIEVVRGPGAVLWGANAVNGVINVITRRADQTQGGLVVAGAGSEERFGAVRYGGVIGGSGGRGRYRVYAKSSDHGALRFADGRDARDPLRLTQGGFRSDWTLSGKENLTVQGDLYQGTAGEAVRDDTDLDGGNLLGRWSRTLAGGSDLALQVYWDRTHRRIPALFEEHRDTWDLDLQHHAPLGPRHDLVWGLGFRSTRDRVVNSDLVAFLPDHRNDDLLNVFAQDEVSFLDDRLRLTAGSKLEHNPSTGFELQPSVRLAWTPDDRRMLWGAVSRAVRTPTRIDEDVRFFANGVTIVQGSRDFVSEELLAWELGYRAQPRPDLLLDVAAYYNVWDHLRSQEPPASGAPVPITLANRLNAKAYGVEVRTTYQPVERWSLLASYAWLGKELRLDPGSRDPSGGRAEGNDPPSRFSLRSNLDLPADLEVNAWLRFVDRLPSPVVPSYWELDLRLAWQAAEHLELALVGQNLLHASHPELGAPAPGREEVQRGVYGKVTWRF